MKNNSYIFILFDCIKLIKGYNRSIIYDLNRESFNYIPNAMVNFLTLILDKEKDFVFKLLKTNEILYPHEIA